MNMTKWIANRNQLQMMQYLLRLRTKMMSSSLFFLNLSKKIDKSLSATSEIKDDLKEIKSLVSSHGQRILNVEDRVSHVETSVSKLVQENEDLRKELYKMNLIIEGIHDPVGEDDDALYAKVKLFICDVVGEDITFDTAFRLGHQKPHFRRPIKVRFLSVIQRNLVYSNRSKKAPPFYINEDLPFSVRRDHGILRDKKRNEIRMGINPDLIKINYKTRTISVADNHFKVQDGILLECSNTQIQQRADQRQHPSSSRSFLGPQ
jgi:archaellum component FlaC